MARKQSAAQRKRDAEAEVAVELQMEEARQPITIGEIQSLLCGMRVIFAVTQTFQGQVDRMITRIIAGAPVENPRGRDIIEYLHRVPTD